MSDYVDNWNPNTTEQAVGTNKVTISDHRGQVVMHFDKRVDYLALTPDEARQCGEALARQAYRAHFGDYPTSTDKSLFTEQRRIRARNRVAQMLRAEPVKSDAELVMRANKIADEVCKLFLE